MRNTIVILALLTTGFCIADTTWVFESVSGVWDSMGNPNFLTGDFYVANDETMFVYGLSNLDLLNEDNYLNIDKIRLEIINSGFNWKAEENEFTLMTEAERRSFLGYNYEVIDTSILKLYGNVVIVKPDNRRISVTPPDHWDWRDVEGNDWTTDIRNQESCGSCWAFATLAPIEAAINIASDDPDRDEDLSEEMLVHDCYPTYNCSGGNYSGSYGYLLSNAICLEDCYPYTATNGPCEPCINWEEESYRIDSFEVYSGSGDTPYERKEAIKEMLMDGPVSVAFTVLSDFYSYSGGVYNSTATPPYPNHGVSIIGYDERGSEPFWICKNSWGSGWGDSGYFNIHMGILHIDDYAYRPIFINNISLAKNNNLKPIDNGYLTALTPLLKWAIQADSANAHFEIQIDENIQFDSPITISSSVSSIGFSPSLPTSFTDGEVTYSVGSQGESLTDGTTYWWRVRAFRSGNYSHWSNSTSFTVNTDISYNGWYQTTSEQFVRDYSPGYNLKIMENKILKYGFGIIFETDFEYANQTDFDAIWHKYDGGDSSGYSSDSLIDLLWYCDSITDTFDVHSPNHCLYVSDKSTENWGYVYTDIDTIQAASVEVWFYFELDTTRMNIIAIHCGGTTSTSDLVGKLFLDYSGDNYKFMYKRGSATYIMSLNPIPYANSWNKYGIVLDCSEEWTDPMWPYSTFPGVSRIYINDTLRGEYGIANDYMNKISFGTNLLYETLKGTGYYDDLSIIGIGDSVGILYSTPIIKDTLFYWNRLFWTQDIDANINIEVQYRNIGDWTTFNNYNVSGSIADFDISGLGDIDTIRLIGIFTNTFDLSICMYDWGVNWSTSPVNIGLYEYLPLDLSITSYPNPFNSAVKISSPKDASVEIFDINGRSIAKLEGRTQIWKPEPSVGSGIYLVRATIGEQSITKRVVYLN